MQEEAAERFRGEPKMTQIAAIYHPLFEIKVAGKVNRFEFIPVPNIDIVLASFHLRKKPSIASEETDLYRDFIAFMFNQWQPTVLDSLKRIFTHEQRKRIARDLKLDKVKSSELSFPQINSLFKVFLQYTSKDVKSIVEGSYRKLQDEQKTLDKVHRTIIREND
jgi:16S rRNA A1518/A1519 N6-dimethyltransferase RsmA/KsgA/DIM1 with predicted DNA glycosylase/AP lyase activity